jgi:hypothetical protein
MQNQSYTVMIGEETCTQFNWNEEETRYFLTRTIFFVQDGKSKGESHEINISIEQPDAHKCLAVEVGRAIANLIQRDLEGGQ